MYELNYGSNRCDEGANDRRSEQSARHHSIHLGKGSCCSHRLRFLKGENMYKKLMCLMAALVLVSACDTTGSNDGEGGANGAGGKAGAARPGTQEDLVVNVGDRVFFGFDKSDLSTEAQATLDRQAAWLKKYPNVKVAVEGHADERGTREYNLALGERRATAAKNYLVAAGIPAARVSTISYGKERPAVVGSNEAAWAQNRRAVTVVAQ